MPQQAFIVGIGGPVGSGKTALVEALCRRLSDKHEVAVITNDIYTKEDAEFLVRREVPPWNACWAWKRAPAPTPPYGRTPR